MVTRVPPNTCAIANKPDNPAAAQDKAALRTSRHCHGSSAPCRYLLTHPALKRSGQVRYSTNYRIDDPVNHDPDITQKLKKKERPDRIYGLRQTRNIENLLNDTAKRRNEHERNLDESQVQEVLGLPLPDQPMNQTGDRQSFPFLVLEAKSGSSADDWHSIRMQTAFSIRTFLETQNRLRAAAGASSRWQSGPLVWFLSNRGEDWRLCAAYVEDGVHRPHTVGVSDYVSMPKLEILYSCRRVEGVC